MGPVRAVSKSPRGCSSCRRQVRVVNRISTRLLRPRRLDATPGRPNYVESLTERQSSGFRLRGHRVPLLRTLKFVEKVRLRYESNLRVAKPGSHPRQRPSSSAKTAEPVDGGTPAGPSVGYTSRSVRAAERERRCSGSRFLHLPRTPCR